MTQSIKAEADEVRRKNDELAPAGMRWLFTAVYHDESDCCCETGCNKGQVMAAINRCEERAARHGGLYNQNLRLVTEKEAIGRVEWYCRRWNEE